MANVGQVSRIRIGRWANVEGCRGAGCGGWGLNGWGGWDSGAETDGYSGPHVVAIFLSIQFAPGLLCTFTLTPMPLVGVGVSVGVWVGVVEWRVLISSRCPPPDKTKSRV